MSSRYSKIQSSIWHSERFKKAKEYRLEYMYLLSCPHGNSAGLFRLPEGYATEDLICSAQRYKNALKELETVGLIGCDGDVIFIRQFLKVNPIMNPNHADGTLNEISDYLKSPLYSEFYKDLQTFCPRFLERFPNSCETVSKPFGNTNTETETNTETNTETKACARERFIPPTLEQVQEYCKEKSLTVDPKAFMDYFTDTGWIDSKGQKVKSWKGKLQTWNNMNGGRAAQKPDMPDEYRFGRKP